MERNPYHCTRCHNWAFGLYVIESRVLYNRPWWDSEAQKWVPVASVKRVDRELLCSECALSAHSRRQVIHYQEAHPDTGKLVGGDYTLTYYPVHDVRCLGLMSDLDPNEIPPEAIIQRRLGKSPRRPAQMRAPTPSRSLPALETAPVRPRVS